MLRLSELAQTVHGVVCGDTDPEITGVAGVEDVRSGEITMAVNARIGETALASPAAAVILPSTGEFSGSGNGSKPVLLVPNPRLAFAQILAYFHPAPVCQPGIHPTVATGNRFYGVGAQIGPFVVIGDDVSIGAGSIIHPGVVVGDRVSIGAGSVIHANVVIREGCVIGERVQIHAGTVIGADGFGYVTTGGKHHKVPQVGNVIIESDVEIGANVTIDRATTGVTRIGAGTKIDNLVQIGHNCQIGEDCIIVAQVGIAGSTRLEERVTMAGKSGAVGHIRLGHDSVVAANAIVINHLPPHSFVSGIPARPHAEDLKITAAASRLPELVREFRELQKRVADMETKFSQTENS